jgi:hypothetical protein
MSLDRNQILRAKDLPVESVSIPAWGGDVHLRKLSAAERMRWTGKYEGEVKGERAVQFICELLVVSICDDAGTPIMDAADLAALAEKDWDNLQLLAAAAMKLNGISTDAIKDAKKN